MNNYVNDDLMNPKYLFHGSPKLLDVVNKNYSHDSKGILENEDNAVFLTSSIKIASSYAFKDTIKNNSVGLNWNFQVNNYESYPIMSMDNVNIDENIEGYIYVFLNDGTFKNDPISSLQFKSYHHLIPIDCIKIYFKDFQYLYEYNNCKRINDRFK